jgi:hypothetical protein
MEANLKFNNISNRQSLYRNQEYKEPQVEERNFYSYSSDANRCAIKEETEAIVHSNRSHRISSHENFFLPIPDFTTPSLEEIKQGVKNSKDEPNFNTGRVSIVEKDTSISEIPNDENIMQEVCEESEFHDEKILTLVLPEKVNYNFTLNSNPDPPSAIIEIINTFTCQPIVSKGLMLMNL